MGEFRLRDRGRRVRRGSVLANRLSEDPNVTVCVLEAGPRDWHPFIHIPAGFMYTLVDPKVNWLLQVRAQRMDRRPRHRGPARQDAGRIRVRSTATSTIAASASISTAGRSAAIAAGATPTCPYFRRGERRLAGDADATFRGSEGNLPITDLE